MPAPLIHRSPLGDVQIPEVPVTEIVLRHAGQVANKLALIEGLTGRLFTYGTPGRVRTQAGGRLEQRIWKVTVDSWQMAD